MEDPNGGGGGFYQWRTHTMPASSNLFSNLTISYGDLNLNCLATLILCEIIFGWFEMVKNCHFYNIRGFNCDLLGLSFLKMSTNSQKFKIQSC